MSSRGGSAWYRGGPEPRRAAAEARGARQALVGKAMVLKAQRYTGLAAGVLERARNAFNWSRPAPSAPRACRVLPHRARFFVRRKQSAPKARPPARAPWASRSDPNVSLVVWSAVCLCGAASSLLLYLSQARARLGFPCVLHPARFILRPAPGPSSGPRAERARARAFAGGLARCLAAAGASGGPGWLRPRAVCRTISAGLLLLQQQQQQQQQQDRSTSSSSSSSSKIGAPAPAAVAAR